MADYNDGKWHGWNGGECPVHPKTIVEVVNKSVGLSDPRRACDTGWDFDGLVAFRVIREHREPREFWISLNNGGIFNSPQENAIHVREVIEE